MSATNIETIRSIKSNSRNSSQSGSAKDINDPTKNLTANCHYLISDHYQNGHQKQDIQQESLTNDIRIFSQLYT